MLIEPIAQDKQNLPGMQQRPPQTSKIESMATKVTTKSC